MEKSYRNGDYTINEARKVLVQMAALYETDYSTAEKTAGRIHISRQWLSKAVKGDSLVGKGNKRLLEALAIDMDDLEKENIDRAIEVFHEGRTYKKLFYDEMMDIIFDTDADKMKETYKWIKTILGSIDGKSSLQEHMDGLKAYFPKLLNAFLAEQKVTLETSYFEMEPGEFCVRVTFPEWVRFGLGMEPYYEYCIASEQEPGSDDWVNEMKDELYFQLQMELQELEKVYFEPDSLQMIKRLQEVMAFDDDREIDWGEFTNLVSQAEPEGPMRPSLKNALLLGLMVLDGREEEALIIRTGQRSAAPLYLEYGLDQLAE